MRGAALERWPPGAAAARQPAAYVASWIYVLRRAVARQPRSVIILSGSILALKGPGWWHFTGVGHFFNSIHLWSVELFFFFMVIHLWGKYWMAAWRGGRARVWMTGAITFLVAIPCALTGYVSQQNFDAQWISTQAKDAMNAAGIGSFFNLTQLRPDVHLPRAAAAGRGGRARHRARPARPPPRRRAAVHRSPRAAAASGAARRTAQAERAAALTARAARRERGGARVEGRLPLATTSSRRS